MMKIVFPFRNLRGSHVDVELLSAYLDAQVTPGERRRIEAHLAECAACRHELAALRQTVTLLQALPRIAVPRAFTLAQTQVGLHRSARQPAWRGGMLRGLAAVSAVAVVAVLTAALLRDGDRRSPVELARVVAPTAAALETGARDAATVQVRKAAPAVAFAPTKAPAVVEKSAPAPMPRAAAPAAAAPTSSPAQAVPTIERTAAPAVAPSRPAEPALAAAAPTSAPTPTAAAASAPARSVTVAPTPGGAGAASTASAAGPAVNAEGAARLGAGAAPDAAARDAASLSALPPTFTLALAVGGNLWIIERADAARPIAQAEGLAAPAISPDGVWIAYRQSGKDGVEVWAAPRAGGAPRRLLTERDLQPDGLTGYQPARLYDMRWLPGGQTLAVVAVAAALAPAAAPRLELWTVEVESATRRLVTHSDIPYPPAAAADGSVFAFLRRAADNPAEADVRLVTADGAGERVVQRVPLPLDARIGDVQISWLPDGRSFWLAMPAASPTGLQLYRIMPEGGAAPPIHLAARQAFWSADGNQLAYVGPADAATGVQELFVAAADGAGARRYATLLHGRFLAWSPDSVHFLYEDGGQLFVGARQAAPSRLASNVDAARWVGADQVVYVTQRDGSRQLVYHALAGQPVVLQTLPAAASLDGLWP